MAKIQWNPSELTTEVLIMSELPVEKSIKYKQANLISCFVSVSSVCESLFSGKDTIMTISSMMNGEYGLNDVCLSHLFVIGIDGVKGCVTPTLTDEEVAIDAQEWKRIEG